MKIDAGLLFLIWFGSNAAAPPPESTFNLRLQFTCISLFPSGKSDESTSLPEGKISVSSSHVFGSNSAVHRIMLTPSNGLTLQERKVTDENCSKFRNQLHWEEIYEGHYTSIFCMPANKFTPESSGGLVDRSVESSNILVTMHTEKNPDSKSLFRGFFKIAYCQSEREHKGIYFGDRMVVGKSIQITDPPAKSNSISN